MATIWRVRDRAGRDVALTDDGWDHIVVEHGADAPSADEIRQAVETPDFVTADVTYAPRENSYRRQGAARPYLKVVVHYRPVPPQGTWAGVVITAFPTENVKAKEQRLWP